MVEAGYQCLSLTPFRVTSETTPSHTHSKTFLGGRYILHMLHILHTTHASPSLAYTRAHTRYHHIRHSTTHTHDSTLCLVNTDTNQYIDALISSLPLPLLPARSNACTNRALVMICYTGVTLSAVPRPVQGRR